MKFIAHRGNVFGPNIELENSPNYIYEAISMGYDVEVDLWVDHGNFFFGTLLSSIRNKFKLYK